MKAFLLTALLLFPIVSSSQSRTPLVQSIDVQIPIAPTPVMIAGKSHLVYELHITNFRSFDVVLTRLEILNADNKSQIADFQNSELNRRIGRPGLPDLKDKTVISPGSRAVVFLWLPLTGANPAHLQHRIEFD